MKFAFLIIALVLMAPAYGADCRRAAAQSRELRVDAADDGYRLELSHVGKWRTLLTSRGEIALPRLALERAEVAFLVDVDGTWSLQLLSLDGSSVSLGDLSGLPAEMCYDDEQRRLLLVGASGTVTPLILP